ncbi:MAG: hypothetical protein HFF05_03210 [Oscillospiraceae bacterium]|nr:hypothetical protein [Oscillospiraceae bacterium]
MPFGMSSSEKKGWFSPALFQKNLARFWPLVAGYSVVQFFSMPLEILLEWDGRNADLYRAIGGDLVRSAYLAVPVGAMFGLMVAMALFSYLMNNRSAGMLHALPIRREGLFLTNWVSGLSFFALPNAVMMFIALLAQAMMGAFHLALTLRWFALHTVIAMFFFCFAVCCAMFTGHILALPVFYGVLNGLVAGLCFLVDNAMRVLLVGYAGSTLVGSALSRWCTPIWHLLLQVERGDGGWFDTASTAIALGYSVVLGAAFTLIAVVVYQHRQLERAGDVVTVGWVRPIFQYGVGACSGLAFGTVIYENFFGSFGPWVFVALVVACAIVGGFVGRMLLKKSLRVFAEGWKGCAGLGLAMLFLLGGARADLFGYQKWVPDPAKVQWISVGAVSSAPYDDGNNSFDISIADPERVEEIIALHREVTEHLDELERAEQTHSYRMTEEGYEVESTTGLRLDYQMEDGSWVSRWYSSVPITAQALQQPESYAARLQTLLNHPDVQWKVYMGWEEDWSDIEVVSGWFENGQTREDGSGFNLTYSQARLLWKAVEEDLDAGRFHRYLLHDKERMENCYYTDLVFHFSLGWNDPDTGERHNANRVVSITVQESATATLQTLEKLGLEDQLVKREKD